MRIKEATLAGPIHTMKSGHLKSPLVNKQTANSKAVEMELTEKFLEIRTDTRNGKELILVPITYISHLVPDDTGKDGK